MVGAYFEFFLNEGPFRISFFQRTRIKISAMTNELRYANWRYPVSRKQREYEVTHRACSIYLFAQFSPSLTSQQHPPQDSSRCPFLSFSQSLSLEWVALPAAPLSLSSNRSDGSLKEEKFPWEKAPVQRDTTPRPP